MAYRNARDQAVASADFAKLGHLILRQRFLRACVYELAFAYIVAVLANLNIRNGFFCLPFALFSLRTLAYTVATYIAGLAVLAAHARLYQVTRAPHSSHFPRLQRLLRSPEGTAIAVGAYTCSACFLLIVHGSMAGGRTTQMWLYPEGYYGAPQLNPSWLASWVLAAAIGVSYSARLIMDERLQLAFPALEQSRIYVLKDRLPSSFTRAIGFAAVAVARFWAVYFIFGWGIYRAVCAVLMRVMSTSSYAVGNPLFSLRANAFWLFSGTLTVLIWEFAHQLFEVIATEPTHINELSLDRNACLVNGLRHSSSQLIQHLAYQELYRLAMFRPDQRSELLTDIDRSTGTMWSQVSAECIGVVKAATSQLAAQNPAKSAKASAATAKPVPGGAGSQEPQRNRGAPMKDILQRNKGSSHGAGAGQSAAAALAGAQSTSTASQSDIFGPEAQGLEKYVLTVLRDALLQSALGQRILSRSLRARSTTAFANFQQQVWAVRSLMRLVECSIKDDEYGVVQADLATVLGTLLAYLAELERSIMQSDSAGGAYRKDYSTQTTSHQAQALIQVLRNSLYTFTVGFYDYFEALKLPANVGRQLQAFANFQA